MENKMFYDAPRNSFEKARWLRKKQTKHEQILWDRLRKKKILGVKIRRQHPIGSYIADFYCHEAKLVIEIDGINHENDDQRLYDQERSFNFNIDGLKVVRFSNTQVEENLKLVIDEITKQVKQRIVSKFSS